MSWIAAGMAAVGVATSIAGTTSQNQKTGKALTSTVNNLNADYTKQIGQLQEQYNSANEDIALEMTTARYNGLKLTGSTTNTIAEKEIAGNTASKAYYQSQLSATFAHNALEKKAEDTWKSFGVSMDNVKTNVNNAIYSAAGKAQSANISTLQAGSAAINAGVSGYKMGSGLSSFLSSTPSTGVADTATGSLTESSGYGGSSVSLSTGYADVSTPTLDSYFNTGGIA